jgi:Bardet-Biedl syndrome 9 protein
VRVQARQALQRAAAELERRSQQYIAVQKRLLVRFKEKTPAPLGSLPALLELTQAEVMQLAAQAEQQQAALRDAAARLSAATALIGLLLRAKHALDARDCAVLHAHLSPAVGDTWEEATDAAMMQLLRTTLAKSARDQSNMPQPLAPPADTARLRKHIALVCERVAKGMRLARPEKEKEKRGARGAAAGAGGDDAAETAGAAPS